MLEMLHGKAKDEAWNNQVKEKLSPALQEEVSFKDAAWPSPFVPGLEYNSPAHATMEYRTYGNAFTRCPSDLCMWCKL